MSYEHILTKPFLYNFLSQVRQKHVFSPMLWKFLLVLLIVLPVSTDHAFLYYTFLFWFNRRSLIFLFLFIFYFFIYNFFNHRSDEVMSFTHAFERSFFIGRLINCVARHPPPCIYTSLQMPKIKAYIVLYLRTVVGLELCCESPTFRPI